MTEVIEAQPRRWAHKAVLLLLLAATIVVFVRHRMEPDRVGAYLASLDAEPEAEMCSVSTIGFTAVAPGETILVKRLLATPAPVAGQETRVIVGLSTPGGRAIGPEELRETHTEKLHLMIVDPTLEDYHHVHPEPAIVPGEYVFSFTPRRAGTYRMFGDLMLDLTGRYAHTVADLEVDGRNGESPAILSNEIASGSYRFRLVEPVDGIRANRAGYIGLDIRHLAEGEPVSLQPIMGAYAHVVVFDETRSGFLHMHPEQEFGQELDPVSPRLLFVFRASEPGDYVAWVQVMIDDEELTLPFRVAVN